MANRIYYKKDKKAQIYRKIEKRDDDGISSTSTFYPYSQTSLWCYSAQLSQNDIFEAKTYGQNETRLFVFNYLKDIKVYDYILYKDEWYRITRVDHTADYNTDTYIYVQNASLGWNFQKDDTLAEYTEGIFKK